MATFQPVRTAGSQTDERREHSRITVLRPRLISVDVADQPASGFLVDVSENGFAIQSLTPLKRGIKRTVSFKPDQNISIEASTEVVWTADGKAGVRVTGMQDSARATFQQWLESLRRLEVAAPENDRADEDPPALEVARAPDQEHFYSAVARARVLTCANGAAIAWKDEQGMVCRASSGDAPACGVRVQTEQGLSGDCIRTREVVVCHDTENDPRVDPEVSRQLNLRSAVIAPIPGHGEVLGLIEVFSSKRQGFNQQDIEGLQAIAAGILGGPPHTDPERIASVPARVPPTATMPSTTKLNAGVPSTATMPATKQNASGLPAKASAAAPPVTAAPVPIRAAPAPAVLRSLASVPEPTKSRIAETLQRLPRLKTIAPLALGAALLLGGGIYVATRASSTGKARPASSVPATAVAGQADIAANSAPPSGAVENPSARSGFSRGSARMSASPASGSPSRRQANGTTSGEQQNEAVTNIPAGMANAPNTPVDVAEVPAPDLSKVAGKPDGGIASVLGSPANSMPVLTPGATISHISPGRVIHKVAPRYPAAARNANREGTVVLRITVAKDGRVKNVRIISGDPDLSRAALDAVSRWRYDPYRMDGEPVDVDAEVRVAFLLKGEKQ